MTSIILNIDFFEKRNKVRNYLHFDKKINGSLVHAYVSDKKKINRKKLKNDKIKKNDYKDKERLINFPSHMDGNIYAYYSKILETHYENFLNHNALEDSVIAFRKISKTYCKGNKYSLCNIHFAKEVFEKINNKKNCTVLCFDISGFFDNLDHDILKENWCTLIGVNSLPLDHFKVYKSLTDFSSVDKKEL